ncbi:MAG: hypothetical protein VXY94_01360 [Planctomycetota bacterium]|nr:hypothetical protein [Planctomycetota bacterium]MEC9232839.1 hypothetical protein [Planctomycetota bacterium]
MFLHLVVDGHEPLPAESQPMTNAPNPIVAFLVACWQELVAAVKEALIFWVIIGLCILLVGGWAIFAVRNGIVDM